MCESNTPLLGIFQDCLCGLYGLAWCNISSPLQLGKGPALLHLRKGFKYTYLVLPPTVKGTSITLPPLPPHHHGFWLGKLIPYFTGWYFSFRWIKRYRNTLKLYRSKYQSISDYAGRTGKYWPFQAKSKNQPIQKTS